MGRVKKRDLPAWMERHQIGLYLAAIALGGGAGFLAPGSAGALEESIYPVLGLLLYATFLGIPFASIGKAARDLRFLATVLVLNFVLVPAVVFGLTRFIAGDQALLVGVLLVLLTPCIDYVIVFTGLAGGASDRLLAAAPVLMLAQMLLLPVYLVVLVGPELVSAIDPAPFVEALVILIIVPLAAAALTQALARRVSLGQVVMAVMQALMVPLMMATLAVVVGSQIVGVGQELGTLVTVVPIYAVFLLVMIPLGLLTAKAAGLDQRRDTQLPGRSPACAGPSRPFVPGRAGRCHPDAHRTDRNGPLRPVPALDRPHRTQSAADRGPRRIGTEIHAKRSCGVACGMSEVICTTGGKMLTTRSFLPHSRTT